LKIYYFSGSGNSYDIARQIAKKTKAELIDIASIKGDIKVEGKVGVVSPCYAFGIPNIVVNFLKKLENKSSFSFFILTYGGYYGGTFKQVNKLLDFDYNNAIKMPGSDSVFMRKSVNIEKNNKIFKEADKKTVEIIKDIKVNRKKKIFRSFEYYLLLPIYLLSIWYFKGAKRGFRTTDKCVLCGVCESCPVDNITVTDRVVWGNKCEGCLRCINYCPFEAIEYKKSTIGKIRYRNPRVEKSREGFL